MKTCKQTFITITLLLTFASSAHAVLGVGDVVTDPGMNMLTAIKNIKDSVFQVWKQISDQYNWAVKLYNDGQMMMNQITQIQNQYNQITQMANAVKGLDTSSLSGFRNSLQGVYNQSNNLFTQLRGMNDSVESIQTRFESSYPMLNSMAKLDPQGWKALVDTTSQEQRNNIYNAKIRAANIAEQNKQLQARINDLSAKNAATKDNINATAQLGNQVAIEQANLLRETNDNLELMLKQQADNYNNLNMLQQAMQLEASKTFQYTKAPATTQGAGIYQIK